METNSSIGNYASVNGIQMYYEIHGNGFPLVLIHGGGSTIGTTFGTILPLLAKNHQVIAIELQAHGHTGDRDTPESFEQDAADVVGLLKYLNIPKVNIFGFSNGGQTAMEIAIHYPNVVNNLVIASAFYNRSGAPEGFWDGFDGATLSNMPKIYKDEYLRITNSQERLQNMFDKDVARMKSFKGWSSKAISSIKAPALVVIGDKDLTLAEHAVEMYRLLPQGRLAILPGNHGSYMGEAMSVGGGSKVPGYFVAMLDEFLAA
jgi:pimeloyl-ACP methyl ester carboxylesterase